MTSFNMTYSILFTFLICYLELTSCSPISPTTSNSSGAFYIASGYFNSGEYFKDGSITCNDSYCHIVCDEEYGCEGLNVEVTSPSTALVLECLSYKRSCFGAVINANAAHSIDLACDRYQLYDLELYPCRELYLYAGDVQNDVNILCNGARACEYADFNASNVGNSFTVTCAGEYACSAMKLSGGIVSQANISCIGVGVCRYMNVDLVSYAPDVTVNIICVNPSEANQELIYAACSETNINIDGYNDNGYKTNNMSYVCGSDDCYGSTLNISDFYSINMECSGSNGGEYSLYAQSSQHLSMKCSANEGCVNAHVFCPTVGTCDFDCIGNGGGMTVEIVNDAYDGLNINYIDRFPYKEVANIQCTDSMTYSTLLWSEYYQNMMCYGSCCPTNYLQPNGKTSTIVPTTTTVEDISTSDPTTTAVEGISTSNPTTTTAEGISTTSDPTTTAVESISTSDPTITTAEGISTSDPTTTAAEDISTSNPTTTAAEGISTTEPTITTAEGLSTSNPTTTVVEDISSTDLSSTSSDAASSFTTTETKKENDDVFDNAARNDDYLLPTIISLAVFIAVAVVIVAYVIKKMGDKIKGLQALTENLQNNNVNIEMNGVTNATPQSTA